MDNKNQLFLEDYPRKLIRYFEERERDGWYWSDFYGRYHKVGQPDIIFIDYIV